MRTISTITIILWGAIAFSQIKSHGSVEVGFKDGNHTIFYDSIYKIIHQYPANTFYADISLDFNWKFIKFEQSLKSNFFYKSGYSFNPLDIEFASRLTFEYKSFAIGYEHSCLHPVISERSDVLEYNMMRGGIDKVFIKFKW